jgi:hypothetical protein
MTSSEVIGISAAPLSIDVVTLSKDQFSAY